MERPLFTNQITGKTQHANGSVTTNYTFNTGDLGNGYIREKDGSVRRSTPKPPPKKLRRRLRDALKQHPDSRELVCAPGCGELSLFFPTTFLPKGQVTEGIAVWQCCLCGQQFNAKSVEAYFEAVRQNTYEARMKEAQSTDFVKQNT